MLQLVPAWSVGTYSLDLTKPIANGAGPTTRGSGFVYFATGSSIRQIKESNNLLNPSLFTPIGSSSQIVSMWVDSSNGLWILKLDGTVVTQLADATGTGSLGAGNAFGTICGGSSNKDLNSISGSSNYVLVTCASDDTIHLFVDGAWQADASTSWTPGQATLANGYAYVANLDSPYDVKKFSLAALDAAPYTSSVSPLSISVTSILAANDVATGASQLRMTTDSQYLWTISGQPTNTIKVVRVTLADNSVSTINLSGYAVNNNSSSYEVGGVSSDGTTLFISLFQQPTVLALKISDSTIAVAANPSMSIGGVQAVSGGFWVNGATAALKYLAPAVTSSDSSAEARKKRQAAIDAARNALVAKIKAGETIVNSDFIAADVTQFNSDLAKRANVEFQIAAKSKSFGFGDVKTIVTKWGIYQDIQNGVRSNVTGRLAYQAGIIPGSVKLKQTLIAQLMNTETSERSSVEKIDALIATLAKKQADQQNRKVEIINKIASGK
jgi:hypothetical protein